VDQFCTPIGRKLDQFCMPTNNIWDEVREKSFGNLAFNTLDALEEHLEEALRTLEQDHPRVKSIVAWPWIIDSLLI
jgi:hypothetical protein